MRWLENAGIKAEVTIEHSDGEMGKREVGKSYQWIPRKNAEVLMLLN